jgi:hypothetical protein
VHVGVHDGRGEGDLRRLQRVGRRHGDAEEPAAVCCPRAPPTPRGTDCQCMDLAGKSWTDGEGGGGTGYFPPSLLSLYTSLFPFPLFLGRRCNGGK